MSKLYKSPINCRACGSVLNKSELNSLNGFVDGENYELGECPECYSLMASIDSQRPVFEIYEKIYRNIAEISGYKRYSVYSNLLNNSFFSKFFSIIYAEKIYYGATNLVGSICEDKGANLRILEIGCGLGYTTAALRQKGFDVTGYDISKEAAEAAEKKHGGLFLHGSIDELVSNYKGCFDVIILLEVIEHLEYPLDYLSNLKYLLRSNGSIIVTTPNRKSGSDWNTTEPPIHVSYFTYAGVAMMAELLNANPTFLISNNNKKKKYISLSRLPGGVMNADLLPSKKYFDNGFVGLKFYIKILIFNFYNRFLGFRGSKFFYRSGANAKLVSSDMDTIIARFDF